MWKNKFKKQTDKKTGETILSSRVEGKDGDSYEDVITVNDQGEAVVTRRMLAKDDDQKYQYSQKISTDENGKKKKLRVRRWTWRRIWIRIRWCWKNKN